jgi:VIT1/CCC1 family predicted Fe2+/Mn2+ transporter
MKTKNSYLEEIKEIRKMMEESSRFLSLSGLSGILVGIYALVGAFVAYRMIYFPSSSGSQVIDKMVTQLTGFAIVIIIATLITVIILTSRRTKISGKKIWNPGSRLMLLNLAIPLITGGLFILIFISRGIYTIVAPSCLIFYGMALINAAKFTRQEIFYMGLLQVSLGILAALLPLLGLLFWALGFGVIHIIYGAVMYFRYERTTNE